MPLLSRPKVPLANCTWKEKGKGSLESITPLFLGNNSLLDIHRLITFLFVPLSRVRFIASSAPEWNSMQWPRQAVLHPRPFPSVSPPSRDIHHQGQILCVLQWSADASANTPCFVRIGHIVSHHPVELKKTLAFNSLSLFLRPTTLPFFHLYSDGIVNANAMFLSSLKEWV